MAHSLDPPYPRRSVSTLEIPDNRLPFVYADESRADLIDFAIIALLLGHTVICHDVYDYGKDRGSNESLFRSVLSRLNEIGEPWMREVGHNIDTLEIWRIE